MVTWRFIALICFWLAHSASECHAKDSDLLALERMEELVLAEPEKALSDLLSLEPNIESSNQATQLLWQLRKAQGFNYSYQFTLFKLQIEQLLTQFDSATSAYVKAMSLMYSGLILQREGEYREAITTLSKAVKIAQSERLDQVAVMSLVELAYALSLEEKYESALLEVNKAYQIADNNHSPFLKGLVEEGNAVVLGYMGKYEQSIKHYLLANEFYTQSGYPYYIGEGAYGLASTYRYQGDFDSALSWYHRYHSAIQIFKSDYSLFFYHYGLAMTYAQQGRCQQSLDSMTSVLHLTEFKDYKAELYKKMAYCTAHLGDFTAAAAALDQARHIYLEIPELDGTSWALEVDKIHSQVLQFRGLHKEAYQVLDKYYQDYFSVHEKNSSERLEFLRLTIQKEREKVELEKLEQQTKFQKLQLKEQLRANEIQRLWLIGALSLGVITLFIAVWQYRMSLKLKALSVTDELTGLANRRFIFDKIRRALKRKATTKTHHTVMLIDVDNLKPINDEFGHQIGDKVLKAVAASGLALLRDGDCFARIGGDEFMLFMTRTNAEQESVIAKRILDKLEEVEVYIDENRKIRISVSIGITSIINHKDSLDTIFSQVDSALYQAKTGGRNNIVHWCKQK
ncbi:MAG: diguanylate cyclase [Kangiellaceae bacterium]|nr:diguanylate cyclase [Kangiellaceae bacterium]MCW8999047.1 diguanylate cyclase [Kangiellaceae bacterium]MCW9016332.1 diguanylate cyclase [Kangiellaceae bacterium]